ncbi:hypothetical protein MHYP_G00110710 [Metynnis hypsauchen]
MRVHLLTARALQLSPEAKSSHSQRTAATHAPLCGSLIQAALRVSRLLALIHTRQLPSRYLPHLQLSGSRVTSSLRLHITQFHCHSARTV